MAFFHASKFTVAVLAVFVVIMQFREISARKENDTISPSKKDTLTKKSSKKKSSSICSTAECKVAGKFFKDSMNPKANPCEDFYEYACGGWLKKNTIPVEKGRWGQFDILRDKVFNECIHLLEKPKVKSPNSAVENARAYYQSCVQNRDKSSKQDVSELRDIISSYANSSLFGRKGKSQQNWQLQLGKAVKELGLNRIIGLSVTHDFLNSTKRKIQVTQPDFGLTRQALVQPNNAKEKVRVSAYKKYMTESFCLLIGGCERKLKKVKNLVEKIFTLESHLAKFTAPPEEMRDYSKFNKRTTISQLKIDFPEIHWKMFINEVFSAIKLSVGEEEEVLLSAEQYLKKAVPYLRKANNDVIFSYICWSILQHFGSLTSKAFREVQFTFEKVMYGIKKPAPWKRTCFQLTNSHLGYAVGNLYVKKHFPTGAKSEMAEIIKNLKTSMGSMIRKIKWMDPATRIQAEEKLKKFRDRIGFPAWILRDYELNKYYKIEPVTPRNFLRSHQRLLDFTVRQALLELLHPSDPNIDWGTSVPAVVNAFYHPQENAIYFPAGILQPPFFHHNTVNALNYGAIGFVIGHEITHGFDDEGCQFDGMGNLRNWWSKKTHKEFNKRKECLIKLYGSITDKQAKMKLNSKNTIGEDIADNGGIRQAFHAFSSSHSPDKRLPGLANLTPNQLFFLAAARVWCGKARTESLTHSIQTDPHSPPMYRVFLSFTNEENFAKAFKCKLGSRMNPKTKCVLW